MGVMRSGLLVGVAVGIAVWAFSSSNRRDRSVRERDDDHHRWEGEGGNVPASQVGAGLQGRSSIESSGVEPAVLGGTAEKGPGRVTFPGSSS